jgi:predicted outer membrane repeat protein
MIIFIASANVYPATYIVPDDFPSIQSAIDAANTGDSIYIRQGVYRENLHIFNKGLFISSFFTSQLDDDIYNTIIDGNRTGQVIFVEQCADTVTIRGLTATNGLISSSGAGVCIYISNAKLMDMLIKDNSTQPMAPFGGGGLYVKNAYAYLKNVEISGNYSFDFGGGLSVRYNGRVEGINVTISNNLVSGGGHSKGGGIYVDHGSSLTLNRSVITGNRCLYYGGGIGVADTSSVNLINVTITENSSTWGGGAIYSCYEESRIFLGNCILYNNWALDGNNVPIDNEIYFDDVGSNNQLAYCYTDIQGGRNNMYIPYSCYAFELEENIDQIPFLITGCELSSLSTCIDEGTDYYYYDGEVVISIPPGHFSGAAPDMGAFEFEDVQAGNDPLIKPFCDEWIKIYPNPSDDNITLEITLPFESKLNCDLCDMEGRSIGFCRLDCRAGQTLKRVFYLKRNGAGTYFLNITGKEIKRIEKIIILN